MSVTTQWCDRLTDERIQLAQKAMSNADSGLERLEGFILKIEDFHRLMNFLEAIHRTTYNTEPSRDRGTIYYYRNFLNARNVKGEVKNSYRAYKHLYYTVFDAMCCVLFLNNFGLDNAESEIPLPKDFDGWTNECKINWINSVCRNLVNKAFFEDDMFMELREILTNPDHEENYWISSLENDRFKCHFCNSSYSYVDSLKAHEKNEHAFQPSKQNSDKTLKKEASDELHDYVLSLFRLTALHKNLDSAVDMGDGYRVVRSAKYETPIYNKTHKIKYFIGSVHLTAMVSGTLPVHQTKRLIANRFINISGGKNSNISLDEYVEILNRDTKNTCSGFQTKESIIKHSKEFPHLINAVKHVDDICNIRGRKGYHTLPSYRDDVKRVVADLLSVDAFTDHQDRKLVCRKLVQANNPFKDCYKGLSEMIVRHRPVLPFRRFRNKHL
ncbi:uncharacterized protein LOC128553655 [Mercenaria mercenaria]|uniref:uncharacterized protein LOC128553655 n=1 Tax=Mercenaria mercenaria TaxID=6596 RepID=UPI00234F22D7|nr:uncharacterized protein LOC128553655 [Mercenaria mercenaria]